MEITPVIPEDKKKITGYGKGFFLINEEKLPYSIIINPNQVKAWNINSFDELNSLTISNFTLDGYQPEIIIIGTGNKFKTPKFNFISEFDKENIGIEFMDTGCACRTYSVLLSEGRNIVAGLIAL